MEHLVDQFDAVSDDSETFTVMRYQRIIRSSPLSGSSPPLKGSTRLALSDGRHVTSIDSVTFKIVATNQIIRKV